MKIDVLVNGQTGMVAASLLATVGLGFISAQTPIMAAPLDTMSEIAKLATKGGVGAIEAMYDARSPGSRAPGALTQTKARRVASLKDAFNPKERVLSGERTRPVDPAAPAMAYELGDVAGPSPAPNALPESAPGIASLESLPPPAWFNPVSGGGVPPIIVGGGGGGGGGSDGGGGGGGGTPGVGPAVPEPATWASLLIGFFAIGFGLRGGAIRRPVLQ